MNRVLGMVCLAVLLAADLHVPDAQATHTVDDALDAATRGSLSVPVPPVQTGIIPIDRLGQQAVGGVTGAEQSFLASENDTVRMARGLDQQPVLYYQDGTGPGIGGDPRHGGFGDWRVLQPGGGHSGWVAARSANHTGNWGLTTARGDGSYPFSTDSILLSPELDLRNGLIPNVAQRNGLSNNSRLESGEFSTVWSTIAAPISNQQACTLQLLCIAPFNWYYNSPGIPPPDALYEFRFDARFNLVSGDNPLTGARDTVQVVLWNSTAPPAFPSAGGQPCLSTVPQVSQTPIPQCSTQTPGTLLYPGRFTDDSDTAPTGLETHYNAKEAGGVATAFSGHKEWQRYTVDLTPWAGQSVWIGFFLTSGDPVGDSAFAPDAGFRGFQLDNLQMTGVAPPVSVRARPPTVAPAGFDPTCQFDCVPTVAPNTTFQVRDDIVNMGFRTLDVTATMEITDRYIQSDVVQHWPQSSKRLAAGEVWHFIGDMANGLSQGKDGAAQHYAVLVNVTSIELADNTTDTARSALSKVPSGVGPIHAPRPSPDLENAQASQAAEADPSDNQQVTYFDVNRVSQLRLDPIERSATTTPVGGVPVRFTLPVENLGNVPATVPVDACVVDWAPYVDPSNVNYTRAPICLSSPLAGSHNNGRDGSNTTLSIPPLGRATVNWTVSPDQAGQYKLFIHVGPGKADDFVKADKLLPPPQGPLQSVYRGASPPAGVTGAADLDSTFWRDVKPVPISLSLDQPLRLDQTGTANVFTPPNARSAALKLANDATHLFLQVNVGNALDSATGGRPSDTLTLSLDDHGDRHANGANNPALPDRVATAFPGADNRRYEFVLPINSTSANGLSAGPGQLVGMLLQSSLTYQIKSGIPILESGRFPARASAVDGGGELKKDGKLDDEMRAWQLVRLANAISAGGGTGSTDVVSPGFGVDRNPPPFFQQDASDCGAFGSWSQSAPGVVGSRLEKWSCAPYGPTGRPLLFEGTSPDSTCGAQACPQYSFSSQPQRQEIYSPPITVDSGAQNPYLVLDHQFSTETWIVDAGGFTENQGSSSNDGTSTIRNYFPAYPGHREVVVHSSARVLMETLENGTWTHRVTLTPDAGYSSEKTVPVGSQPRLVFYGSSAHGGLAVSDDPNALSNWDDYVDGPSSAYVSDNQGCVIRPAGTSAQGVSVPCAFWWPTGFQPLYQPPGAPQATGQAFSGSPWRVDRFPLSGVQYQFDDAKNAAHSADVVAAGKTVRFVFQFFPSHEPRASDDPYLRWVRDYGWRIGGLAVQEGPGFQRDIAVTNLTVEGVRFDPAQTGVGPNTTLQVKVDVANNGNLNPGAIQVTLRGRNVRAAGLPDICTPLAQELDVTLAPGAHGSKVFACAIPASADGGLLQLEASANAIGSSDDFPADNQLSIKQPYQVHTTRDVAALLGTDLPTGPVGSPRGLDMLVENRGNVPLTGITVTRTILDDNGNVLPPIQHWALGGTLAMGARASLADLQPDQPLAASFTPPVSGDYRVVLAARVAGDTDASDDGQAVLIRAVDSIYANGFELGDPRHDDSGTVQGDGILHPAGVWRVVQDEGSKHHLQAGDPVNREIPANTDANGTVELPPVDLTTVKGATLAFRHRYDLESSFDAGRVEISTNGTTWRPLIPDRVPLGGLPEGYPSLPLLAGPFLDGQAERTAAAYTGNSADLTPQAAADGGWVQASFDLSHDPALRQSVAVDAFSLDGLGARPIPAVSHSPTGDNQFIGQNWTLNEPGAAARQRQWWVQDEAYDVAPHSNQTMWWSGGGVGVNTTLDFSFPLTGCPTGAAASCRITWWEWRAGSGDGDPAKREGSGGLMATSISSGGGVFTPVQGTVVRAEPSGWVMRAIDLQPFFSGTQGLTLRFLRDSNTGPMGQAGSPAQLASTQKTLGFFVDDPQLYVVDTSGAFNTPAPGWRAAVATALDLDHLQVPELAGSPPAATADRWTITNLNATNPHHWDIVRQGDDVGLNRDLGWRVEDTTLAGRPARAWHFGDSSSQAAQAYPTDLDVRLVTPVVDLSQATGESARLQFDQAYNFESILKCPNFDASCVGSPVSFVSAVDGGAVEMQVYDDVHGTFGPWQQLGARFRDFPANLNLSANTALFSESAQTDPGCNPTQWGKTGWSSDAICGLRMPDRLSDKADAQSLLGTGYTAIAERGDTAQAAFWPYGTSPNTYPIAMVSGFVHAGTGTSFEVHNGSVERQWTGPTTNCRQCVRRINWAPYPVSYVFSGNSGGWGKVDWDISPLVGHKVRFAFHAVSNPGSDGARHQGWQVANVEVATEVFRGAPAKLRLHLATDGTSTKGDWSVDDITLVGQHYGTQVAIVPTTPARLLQRPGSLAELEGRLANLGSSPVTNLILSAQADMAGQPLNVTIDPPFLGSCPFSLAPRAAAGQASADDCKASASERPFRLNVTLPGGVSGTANVRLFLLQGNGGGYGVPSIESPGAAQAQWTVAVQDLTSIVPVSPTAGRTSPVVADPSAPHANQTVTFRSAVRNDGTAEPNLTAVWTFQEVKSKGSASQPFTKEDLGTPSHAVMAMGVLRRGETNVTEASFTPDRTGLYRAHVDYYKGSDYQNGNGAPAASTQLEVLVGIPGIYSRTDFSNPTQAANWTDRSRSPSGSGGGSPQDIRFRPEGGDLVWGVDDNQLSSGFTYCSPEVGSNCNPPVPQNGNTAPPITDFVGLEGLAQGPLVDLRRVPQGSAVLALENKLVFQGGDGALLEGIPLQGTGSPPIAAITCPSTGGPMAFSLKPESDFMDQAASIPGRQGVGGGMSPPQYAIQNQIQPLTGDQYRQDKNKLDNPPTPILGGQGDRQVLRFRLDQLAASTCSGSTRVLQLVNYTVQFQLHTGTLPGYDGIVSNVRRGAQGWRIGSIDVASTGVEVSPHSRLLPMKGGVTKQFRLEVHNVGQQPDTFRLAAVPSDSLLPPGASVTFLQDHLFLEPGAQQSVPYTVSLPDGTPAGGYLVTLEARSTTVATVSDTSQVVLDLQATSAPDLAVTLAIQAPGTPASVEEGQRYSLHATVFNLGSKESGPVTLRFFDTDRNNVTTRLDDVPLPTTLCSASATCVGGGRVVKTYDWMVSGALGSHTLSVVADPDGLLAEPNRANNRATVPVEVVPAALPHLVVMGKVTGLGPDGMAEEGGSLGVRVNITNVGSVAAKGFNATLDYGVQFLGDLQDAELAPGQTRTLEASFDAHAGDDEVVAEVVFPQDRNIDDHHFRTVVHTHHHNLTLSADPPSLKILPGGTGTVQFTLASTGTGVDQVSFRLLGAPEWGLAVDPSPTTVAPGGTALAQATVRAPLDAPAGDTLLRLRAEPAGNHAAGIESALHVTVAAVGNAPILEASDAALDPGPAALPVAVASHSNFLQHLNLTLAGLPWQGAALPVALEPFANRSLLLPLVIPPDAAPGPHAAALLLRNGTTVLAQRLLRLTVRPVAVASAAWTGAVLPGPSDPGQRTLRMSLLVRNAGNVPFIATAAAGPLGQGLSLEGGTTPGPVPVGGAVAIPIVVQVAGDAPDPNDGVVEVWIQPLSGGNQAGLGQQAASIPLPRLQAAPDLHVARIDRFPAGVATAGDAVYFRIQVENLGPVEAPPSRLHAFVNGDLLDDPLVPAIPPGQSRQVNVTATFDHAGPFLVTVLADGEGTVAELQESNNGAAQTLDVQEPPPLSVHGVQRMLPAPAGAFPALLGALLVAAWARRRREAAP